MYGINKPYSPWYIHPELHRCSNRMKCEYYRIFSITCCPQPTSNAGILIARMVS